MHFYADDTQLYVSFENNAPEQQSTAVTRLNTCIGDIRNWLANNMLKLNDDKTEVILFTSKHALKSHPNVAVTVGEQPVRPATSIHNLGVVYDQPLPASVTKKMQRASDYRIHAHEWLRRQDAVTI